MTDVLDRRALNRATLARQLLLERSPTPVVDTVGALVGLQAQEPPDPYIGLWSRLDGFRPDDLVEPLVDRRLVRIVAMRGTIHLLTADDAVGLRALVQPVLDKELARHPEFGPELVGVDLAAPLAYARRLLAEAPRSGRELRAAMAERFDDLHPGALAYACRNHLAVVQVPPRGLWGRSAQVRTTTTEAWLGRSIVPEPSIDAAVRRYLAAFGPATVADVAAWSGLTGLRAVVDRLRPELVTFRDERGRELVDLPDGLRPDPDVPAPPRFLPQYDNALLGHADRSRLIDDDVRRRLAADAESRPGGGFRGSLLVDGECRAGWRLLPPAAGSAAVVEVRHVGPLAGGAADDVVAEGVRLAGLLVPDAGDAVDVRIVPVDRPGPLT